MLDKVFSPEVMAKVLYAFIALSIGSSVAENVKPASPDLIEYRLVQVEKRIEKLIDAVEKINEHHK